MYVYFAKFNKLSVKLENQSLKFSMTYIPLDI